MCSNTYQYRAGASVVAPITDGIPVTRRDLDNMLAATIIPFLFGYIAPVRPTMLLTLQHPNYTVSAMPLLAENSSPHV